MLAVLLRAIAGLLVLTVASHPGLPSVLETPKWRFFQVNRPTLIFPIPKSAGVLAAGLPVRPVIAEQGTQ